MPTAFVASAGNGKGPVIALLAEMDALPGMSQAALPEHAPVDGQDAGHACGHNLFGAGSVAAARAIAQWLRDTGRDGEVRVYGTPAEEGGRSEEHTSELQSLMRLSYSVFGLKKKNQEHEITKHKA